MLGNGAHKMNGNTTTTTTIVKRGKRQEETVFESILREKGRDFIAQKYSEALHQSVKRDPTFNSYEYDVFFILFLRVVSSL